MFGNYPLPNIAPSLLLLLPPPSHMLLPPPPPPSPSRPPTWAKQGHACHQRPPTTFTPRHRVPPPLHRQPQPPHHRPPPLPLLRDVGEWFLPCHAAQTMTAPCYVTANDNHPMPHHPTKAPAIEHHVTKMEGVRRREMEGGGGKEEKRETAGGEEGICAPSLLQRHFGSQQGSVHPTYHLVWPSRCEQGGVHPTHHLI